MHILCIQLLDYIQNYTNAYKLMMLYNLHKLFPGYTILKAIQVFTEQ